MAKKKKRNPAQMIQTKVHVYGVGNPKNRNPEKKFKVSKSVQDAADKVGESEQDKKIKKKINTKLRVKDQKLPNPKVPKSKVDDKKIEGKDSKLKTVTVKKKKRKSGY